MRLSFITSADGLCNGDVLDRLKLSEDLPDRYVISFTEFLCCGSQQTVWWLDGLPVT